MTKQEQLDFIKKNSYMDMIDTKWVMSELNVSIKTVQRRCRELGIYHTDAHIIEMIKRYLSGESCRTIIQEYGCSQANFHALLRRRNIEARHTQYKADFDYFNEINTEAKAYFLGFIYADGCLYRNTLKITILAKDIDILQKLKKDMESNHPIRTEEIEDDRSGFGACTTSTLRESLIKHGVVPRKTHKLSRIPSTVPRHLLKHFIRGYMDGDGSFSCYQLKSGCRKGDCKYIFSIVGTKQFLEDMRTVIQENVDIPLTGELQDRWKNGTNTRSLRGTGKGQVLAFLDWLYKDATVYLDRKFNKYNQLLR